MPHGHLRAPSRELELTQGHVELDVTRPAADHLAGGADTAPGRLSSNAGGDQGASQSSIDRGRAERGYDERECRVRLAGYEEITHLPEELGDIVRRRIALRRPRGPCENQEEQDTGCDSSPSPVGPGSPAMNGSCVSIGEDHETNECSSGPGH